MLLDRYDASAHQALNRHILELTLYRMAMCKMVNQSETSVEISR